MEWNIVSLDCYPEFEGKENCVFTAHWDLTETEGEYSGRVYGSGNLTLDAEAPFTPYSQLTKEQVIGWVKDAMGAETVAAHESAVAQQIEDQKNPKVVTPPLPWATPAV